jgi:UDP-N-acetylmuramate dehydrogenase
MAIPRAHLVERIGRYVQGEVRADEPLAPWTTIRAGGPAELWVRPASADALVAVLRMARSEGEPVCILGGGANTLVGDAGVPGVTLKLPADLFPESAEVAEGKGRITLGGGAAIVRVVNQMRHHRLVGVEFLVGIPGTIGGAVAMNAGTKLGECMSAVDAVELATADGVGWLERREIRCQYRHTELPPGAVVTRVRFALREGDLAASQAQMDADLAYRKRTQPLSLPSFGSVFQNPPGDYAGRLVEKVGLKGRQVGQAQISTLHANFIVNLGGAAAQDVVALIELARSRVAEELGVQLVPEVKRVGVFR